MYEKCDGEEKHGEQVIDTVQISEIGWYGFLASVRPTRRRWGSAARFDPKKGALTMS